MWLVFAFGSALFAGVTAILAKVGVRHTPSNLATAIRTCVVLLFAWLVVFVVGSQSTIGSLSGPTLFFLGVSGLATGASWLCYFRALQLADVNQVVPIDKSSIVLTVAFAILLLGETDHLAARLSGIAVIAVGTYLMIERRPEAGREGPGHARPGAWLAYAVASAVFAALTSILGKVGIAGVESNLGTALRTVVVLVMAWIVVLVSGEARRIGETRPRELAFIVASGVATGASWLCYFRALKLGDAARVAPVDKLSVVLVAIFGVLFLGEHLSPTRWIGVALIAAGAVLTAL